MAFLSGALPVGAASLGIRGQKLGPPEAWSLAKDLFHTPQDMVTMVTIVTVVTMVQSWIGSSLCPWDGQAIFLYRFCFGPHGVREFPVGRFARSVEQLTLDFQSRLESLEEQKSLEEPIFGMDQKPMIPCDSHILTCIYIYIHIYIYIQHT